MMVEVDQPSLKFKKRLDPVVSIVDEHGEAYQTCRNPGDDHTQAPGIADATPDAFDDICVNDDINPGVDTNARLEILVPGDSKSHVNLNIRVSDWNGLAHAQVHYQMQVSETGEPTMAIKAAGQ